MRLTRQKFFQLQKSASETNHAVIRIAENIFAGADLRVGPL